MSVWWGLLFLNILRNVTNVYEWFLFDHDYIVFLFVIPFVSETEGRFWKSYVLPQWWEGGGGGVSFLIFITRENTRLRLWRLWIFPLFAIPDFSWCGIRKSSVKNILTCSLPSKVYFVTDLLSHKGKEKAVRKKKPGSSFQQYSVCSTCSKEHSSRVKISLGSYIVTSIA